jgi:hypothetical protein
MTCAEHPIKRASSIGSYAVAFRLTDIRFSMVAQNLVVIVGSHNKGNTVS